MLRRMHSPQKSAAARSSVYDHLDADRTLISRDHHKLARTVAPAEQRRLGAA